MKNDPAKWNNKDITKIERSLHKFISLIWFYNIESSPNCTFIVDNGNYSIDAAY